MGNLRIVKLHVIVACCMSLTAAGTLGARNSGTCNVQDLGSSVKACNPEGAECQIEVDGVVKNGLCKTWQAATNILVCACMPLDGTVPEETEATGTKTSLGPLPVAPAEEVFTLSPGGIGNVTVLPEEFGGGAISVTSYSGSVTVRSTPTGDPNIELIEIVGGSITAPAVTLPTGGSTGMNVFTFLGPGEAEGFLNRATGEFHVSAIGELRNDAIGAAGSLRTVGDYFGTADLETGTLIIDSTTLDSLELTALGIPTLKVVGFVLLILTVAIAGFLALCR